MTDGIPPVPTASPTQVGASRASLERQLAGSTPKEAADKMEALFATLLVKEMRRALPNGFFGSGVGSDTFEGWLDEHLGQSLADSDSLGLAGQIKVSLERKAQAENATAEAAAAEDVPRTEDPS